MLSDFTASDQALHTVTLDRTISVQIDVDRCPKTKDLKSYGLAPINTD